MPTKPDNWSTMTAEEKRAWRLENFRNSGQNVKFVSPEAEKNYRTRVNRLIDVYDVEEADRVPVDARPGNPPLAMAGPGPRASVARLPDGGAHFLGRQHVPAV